MTMIGMQTEPAVGGKKTGIILEGGAMRSIFSAGVLDCLMEKKIHIPNVLAVSAGAYAGMNYVSGQKGRILEALIKPLEDYKYLGFGTFLKKGTFFDMDYLFDVVPKEKSPFDFEAFCNFAGRFLTSTINMTTGETIYFDSFSNEDFLFKVCKAANSLPIIAKITDVEGSPMLDGGMADAIPLTKALEEGWQKVIVVLTRDKKYRKKEGITPYIRLIRLLYGKYPAFLKTVEERAKRYNTALDNIARMEEEGRAFVVRPTTVTLENKEDNPKRLMEYYRHGYETMEGRFQEFLEFIEQ